MHDYVAVLQKVVAVRQFAERKVKWVGVYALSGVVMPKLEYGVAVAKQVKEVVDTGPFGLDDRKRLEAMIHHYQS